MPQAAEALPWSAAMNERMQEAGATSPGEARNGRRGTEAINEDIADFAARVQSAGGEAAESLKDHARQTANEQKDAGARMVRQVARAIERAADELGESMPRTAQYVRGTAKQVGELSHSLSGRSVEDLANAFTHLARTRPGMVLGAGALAGFALTRFLKSASSHSTGSQPAGSRHTDARPPSTMGRGYVDRGSRGSSSSGSSGSHARQVAPSLQPNGDTL